MTTVEEFLFPNYKPASEYSSFRAYLDEQTEFFIESMQHAADNHWHSIEAASEKERGRAMNHWWNSQIRRFRNRLRELTRREEKRQNARRLRRLKSKLEQTQMTLEETQATLQEVQDELVIEKGLADLYKRQFRCRQCNGDFWG